VDELQIHPRVTQQGISESAARAVLVEALPRLKTFREYPTHAVVALLDWDHHLPSRALTMHLHVCYDSASTERLQQALARRREEIAARDFFPEFDVPDYGGLPADESYDVELSADFRVDGIRLVSPWRREIAEEDAQSAIAQVRASKRFSEVKRLEGNQAGVIGMAELEAVAWTPPCESGQPMWTLDVWWLTSFDGRVGKGWSFLVDFSPSCAEPVVASREFTVRAG
jgi:hypothetical protein